jgi:negative regulator of sigma E activity
MVNRHTDNQQGRSSSIDRVCPQAQITRWQSQVAQVAFVACVVGPNAASDGEEDGVDVDRE